MHKKIAILVIAFAIMTFTIVTFTQPAGAQQTGKIARIGWIGVGAGRNSTALQGLRAGLRRLGRIEEKTYTLEQRWWDGHSDNLKMLVGSLVAAKVDVIVAQGPAAYGTRHVTGIPVVFGFSGDPIAAGFARSYAKPGGNKTGATYMSVELNGKRLGLVKEVLPDITRVAILSNPQHPGEPLEIEETRAAGRRIGVTIHYLPVRSVDAITAALAAVRAAGDQAIIAVPDAFLGRHRKLIGAFAIRERIPVIYGWPSWIGAGGLLTYGADPKDAWPRIAIYVDKILKGAMPADLAVERPTKFKLVINLKTAKVLGITIPPSILLSADEVIE